MQADDRLEMFDSNETPPLLWEYMAKLYKLDRLSTRDWHTAVNERELQSHGKLVTVWRLAKGCVRVCEWGLVGVSRQVWIHYVLVLYFFLQLWKSLLICCFNSYVIPPFSRSVGESLLPCASPELFRTGLVRTLRRLWFQGSHHRFWWIGRGRPWMEWKPLEPWWSGTQSWPEFSKLNTNVCHMSSYVCVSHQ